MLMKEKVDLMKCTLQLSMITVTVTGIKANVLEKHVGLSKAADAVSAVNSPQKIYYPQYLADFSEYLHG